MNRLIIDFKYGAYPVWLADQNGTVVLNDLPWELAGEEDVDELFREIQDIYDGLWTPEPGNSADGRFRTEGEKTAFLKLIDQAINRIRIKTAAMYEIEKRFDPDKL